MGFLEGIGAWIAANESLLSGLAALVAVAWVILSPVLIGARRLRRRDTETPAPLSVGPAEKLTYRDLVRPSPHPIRYADSDGLRIAYEQFGEGDPPIVMAPGIVSHLHVFANLPTFRNCLDVFARHSSVTVFDKRGQGLSDPFVGTPSLEQRSADIGAVMDDAGIESAVLVGISEGGPMCIQFAHDHPERVRGLILVGTAARFLRADDYPIGLAEEQLEAVERSWGKGVMRDVLFPSLSRDVVDDETYRAMEKLLAARDSIGALVHFMKLVDVRPLLSQITAPTLVIHFIGDISIPSRMGRALAEGIPGAQFHEVEGTDHADFSQSPEAVAAIRDFCAGLA
jgi:pimeloyl-ACP methyl ester carboxylesterase